MIGMWVQHTNKSSYTSTFSLGSFGNCHEACGVAAICNYPVVAEFPLFFNYCTLPFSTLKVKPCQDGKEESPR
jgi:hypothetical protein